MRPDLLVQVSEGALGAGVHCIEFERSAVSPQDVAHKLGPYRRIAAAGHPLPLLTATLERALAGPASIPSALGRKEWTPANLAE